MFYLASGYEERVREESEGRVTRLNAWKGARVQRMHVRQGLALGRTSGARGSGRGREREGTGARGSGRPRACAAASGYGLDIFLRGCKLHGEDDKEMMVNVDHAILMKKSQEALMIIDDSLSVVLEDLEIFSCKCTREAWGGRFGKGRVALGQFVGPMAEEEKPGKSSSLD
ncbi:hypothetical protein CDL15_Pgr008315 [Punica granatum]|uniref:Uncharacterized protein n=1 Tax=Punica granatum TaxID=22663 RepID=A0A218XTC0_PUNGR|nr:hypothetical protein CDL15_Pgr008315 [Punica granatum]PKI37497.1 hypothetical protein CRG98_042111 [Punica granatum]